MSRRYGSVNFNSSFPSCGAISGPLIRKNKLSLCRPLIAEFVSPRWGHKGGWANLLQDCMPQTLFHRQRGTASCSIKHSIQANNRKVEHVVGAPRMKTELAPHMSSCTPDSPTKRHRSYWPRSAGMVRLSMRNRKKQPRYY